jgi:hypothetical protein
MQRSLGRCRRECRHRRIDQGLIEGWGLGRVSVLVEAGQVRYSSGNFPSGGCR